MARSRKEKNDLKKWHKRAVCDVGDAIGTAEPTRKKLLETIRFVRIPGAQWEGSTNAGFDFSSDRFEKYPRFELNKIGREIDRIITDYRMNRVNVTFRPKDTAASDGLAEKLNGKFRADFQESNGGEAIDNCYDDGIAGGFGAFRLSADLYDECDPENESRQIRFHPIYDPITSVFFDPDAKMYDRADANWCAEVFSMTRDKYERKYPNNLNPSSIQTIDSGKMFDWVTDDCVYLARYYEVKIEDVTVTAYTNPVTQEQEIYDEDEIEDVAEQLARDGFEKGKSRKIKRRKVYCGVMSGGEWITEPERIAGEWIPVVPFYCRRTFIDGQERVTGHATQAMDAQRLENLLISMLADNATQAGGDNIPIIDVEFLPGKLAQAWEMRNKNRPAYLPMQSMRDAKGNIIAPAQVSGYTQPTPLSAGAAGLLDYTGQAIQQITGASNMESLPSNLATETVEAIFSRIDGTSALYMDNLAKSLRHAGRIWLSMAREVYGTETPVRLVDEQGNDSMGLMSASVVNKDTGEVVGLNDLKRGKYEVVADVGESSQTRRQQVVKNLTALLQTTDPASDTYQIILGLILENTDGEGLEDVKEWNRNKLVQMGVLKPRTQEEEKAKAEAEQAAAQQQDPAMELAKAEQMKGQASIMGEENKRIDQETKRMKLWLDTYSAYQNGKLTQAQVIETLAKVDSMNHAQILDLLNMVNSQQQANAADAAQQATGTVNANAAAVDQSAQGGPQGQPPAPSQNAPQQPQDPGDLQAYSNDMAQRIAQAAQES